MSTQIEYLLADLRHLLQQNQQLGLAPALSILQVEYELNAWQVGELIERHELTPAQSQHDALIRAAVLKIVALRRSLAWRCEFIKFACRSNPSLEAANITDRGLHQ